MKNSGYLLLCIVLFSIVAIPESAGQNNNNTYNYNVYNGLPSNHTYGVITDQHGYLWIATDNGVVKYNGYNFKVFNLATGLSSNDNWQLFEDKKGRIWLCNTWDDFGYIFNDKFYKAYTGIDRGIYPRDIRRLGDGVIFYSDLASGKGNGDICIEKNDTIHQYEMQPSALGKALPAGAAATGLNVAWPLINFAAQPRWIYKANIFSFDPLQAQHNVKWLGQMDTGYFEQYYRHGTNTVIGKYMLSYISEKFQPYFYACDLDNGAVSCIRFDSICKENVQYITYDGDTRTCYVITRQYILEYSYSNGITFRKRTLIKDLIGPSTADGTKIHTIINNYWGGIVGTSSDGLYILNHLKNTFTPLAIPNATSYSFIGNVSDTISYWWNASAGSLMTILPNTFSEVKPDVNTATITRVFHLNGDTLLLAGNGNYYYLPRENKILPVKGETLGKSLHGLIAQDPGCYYIIGPTFFSRLEQSGNKFVQTIFDYDKYSGMVYDTFTRSIIVYNYNKIFIHGPKGHKTITKDELYKYGIKKIEKIEFDNKYGNMFFKGPDRVVAVYGAGENVTELFTQINSADAMISLRGDVLCLAGKFGVAFCKILGPMKFSSPVCYYNTKGAYYQYARYADLTKNRLLLSTDKGMYQVPVPPDSELLGKPTDSIFNGLRFIYKYNGIFRNFNSGDTVCMEQQERLLQFDVINPYGTGPLKYTYSFSPTSGWQELNVNELNIPSAYLPGQYYTLFLNIHDDIWRSAPIALHIYIKPRWYQTRYGRILAWAIAYGLIALFLLSLILLTRNIVLKASKKRTMRLELELKAIYAQINPHFIFNTLSSALSLIKKNKMEEVYDHISKFSSLLRSYIKASRNKLLTLEEEIENLTDYLDLQQARFKGKFRYTIFAHSSLSPGKIYIPSLLIQPFVENAINHGILPLEETGNLNIEFLPMAENELVCVIDDDGIGRKKSKALAMSSGQERESYGDLLIKDLVAIFNRYETMNIEIAYADKQYPLTGTTVTIRIKNPQHA